MKRMISLREVIFLGCIWCVSCQTNMTTELSNTTSPPITELVTEPEAGNITTQPLSMTTIKEETTTMMTSSQPTTAGASPSEAAQSTAAATSTVAMETRAQRSTQKGTTIVAGTTYVKVTTKKKSPAALSSGVIALICIIAFLLFILILAGIAYLCRRRSVAQKIKRRFSSRPDVQLSIHRPESGLILEETRVMNSFDTDRNLDTICHENSLFIKEEDTREAHANGANGKATLPSTASLKIANEKYIEDSDVPSNDKKVQNGDLKAETFAADDNDAETLKSDNIVNDETVNSDDVNAETVTNGDIATDIVTNGVNNDTVTSNDMKTEIAKDDIDNVPDNDETQQHSNGDAENGVLSDSDPKPKDASLPTDPEQQEANEESTGSSNDDNEDMESTSKAQTNELPYKSTDGALQEVGEEMKI